MHKREIARQLGAIAALPVVVTIIVPTWFLVQSGDYEIGWGLRFPLNLFPTVVALALIGEGLLLVTTTIRLFVTLGEGTLAPWDPTQRLVVAGIYRYVRNPMLTGIFSILLGETVLFRSIPLLLLTLGVIVVNLIYIPLVEEPGLRRRFRDDYDLYARHVPRWIPRRTPWRQTSPP